MREDAAALAPSYAPRLTADDLMGLARWEFAMRPLVDGQTLAPLTGSTLPLPPVVRDGVALAEASRERYGKPRNEVEAALKARGRAPDGDDRPRQTKRTKNAGSATSGSEAKDDSGSKSGSETGRTMSQPFGRRRKATDGEGSTGQAGDTS